MRRWISQVTTVVLTGVNRTGSTRYNIVFVDGFQPPSISRTPISYHWENRRGEIIHHPSAYSRVGWSSIRYIPAVRGEITVGIGWSVQEAIVH